jgi:hypothetical protein
VRCKFAQIYANLCKVAFACAKTCKILQKLATGREAT